MAMAEEDKSDRTQLPPPVVGLAYLEAAASIFGSVNGRRFSKTRRREGEGESNKTNTENAGVPFSPFFQSSSFILQRGLTCVNLFLFF